MATVVPCWKLCLKNSVVAKRPTKSLMLEALAEEICKIAEKTRRHLIHGV
jgi:hypothetical protein